jgi:hypothetical protein
MRVVSGFQFSVFSFQFPAIPLDPGDALSASVSASATICNGEWIAQKRRERRERRERSAESAGNAENAGN